MTDFVDRTITALTIDGFGDSELTSPARVVKNAGATVHVIFTEDGSIGGKNDTKVDVDKPTSSVPADDYDALVLPGGTVNVDQIHIDEGAVTLVKGFTVTNKPIGVTCHGGWIFTDADALKGRTITPYTSAKADLVNVGVNWVDEEVVVNDNLIFSHTPTDLEVFNKALVENF